jgi:hypothetical protein
MLGPMPDDGLIEDLSRNGGGKGCVCSNGQLTGSNGCAMDTRDAAPEPAAALREDECELVLYVGGKVVRVAHTKQEMRVAIAGLGMI